VLQTANISPTNQRLHSSYVHSGAISFCARTTIGNDATGIVESTAVGKIDMFFLVMPSLLILEFNVPSKISEPFPNRVLTDNFLRSLRIVFLNFGGKMGAYQSRSDKSKLQFARKLLD